MSVTSLEDVKYVKLEATGKYFLCDQRYTNGAHFGQAYKDGYPYMLIHSGSVKPLEFMAGEARHFIERWTRKPDFMYIVEARTRGQVKEYLVGAGHITQFGGKMHWPNPLGGTFSVIPMAKGPVTEWITEPPTTTQLIKISNDPAHNRRESTMNKQAMKDAEKAKIKAAKRRIKAIDSIPDEPQSIGEGPVIIQFQKLFHKGGRVYDYAAVKAGDGLWYTTGPQSPKGYSWDQLIRWIYEGDFVGKWSVPDGIWVASEYIPVV